MSNPPTFVIGERVLCYHGPLIYEAKVRAWKLEQAKPTDLSGVA